LALWDHSLQVAVLAREFCYRVRYPVPEEVFVSGIIHDIGQVLLSQLIGDPYRRFLARTHADGQDLAVAEQSAFGTDHAELGARLTAKWNFPASLELAVRHHHRLPEGQAGLAGIAPLVLAANVVALVRDRGRSGEDILAEMPAGVRELLRLDLDRLEEVLAAGAEEYGRIRGSFDLTSKPDGIDGEPGP
jgi:putative nucleotidyltransferase with HDIG domain